MTDNADSTLAKLLLNIFSIVHILHEIYYVHLQRCLFNYSNNTPVIYFSLLAIMNVYLLETLEFIKLADLGSHWSN